MDVKITQAMYDSLRQLGISKSFEELDVDGDGKLSEADAKASKDSEVASQIRMLQDYFNSVDDEAQLVGKIGAEKTGDGEDDDWADLEDDFEDLEDEVGDLGGAGATEGADEAGALGAAAAAAAGAAEGAEKKEGTYDEAKMKELRAKLDKLKDEIADLEDQIAKLEEENEKLQKDKEKFEEEQKTAEGALATANGNLADEEADLQGFLEEFADVQEEVLELNKQILREQNREQENYELTMQQATNKAIDEYNPAEHGDDFNAYFNQKMSETGFPVFGKLASLNDEASGLTSKASSLMDNISSKSTSVAFARTKANTASANLEAANDKVERTTNTINSNLTAIQGLQTTLDAKKAEKDEVNKEISEMLPGGGLTAKEVLASISQCEKDCVKKLGWKIEDCVFAMGEDGAFHIYPKSGGAGAVRAAYGNAQYGEEALGIVPMGSGYISGLQEAKEGNGRAVYTFSCVNDDWTDGECECMAGCYSTCSPLSFDVDGDGVNTSSEMVRYDIDGDGQLDNVNNSAEWVLAFDKDGNGKAGENGSELFGDNTDLDGDGVKDGYKNGFEALKALAIKEGLISSTDRVLDEDDIKKLTEKYGLVMTKGYGGQAKSLADLGITEINLASTDATSTTKDFDGRGNDIMRQEGATFKVNGETREYADIWNAKKDSMTDEEKAQARLNPEFASFQKASTEVKSNKKLSLGLNKDRVISLQGNVDFKAIEKEAMEKAKVPKDLLDEVIEIEEDE